MSHPLFMNIPTDISSKEINTISIHKDYVKVIPFTIDATPLSYNSFPPNRIGNNSLNSTIMQQENQIETRNHTQPEEVNEEVVEKIATTTQQSISSIHPNLTTSRTKKFNTTTGNNTIQS